MTMLNRRDTLKLAALAPLASGFTWLAGDAQKARDMAAAATSSAPQFFTAPEFELVKVLVDMILPADGRSGSATEAGVHDFMDFMMIDRPEMQVPMRGGLAWIEYQSLERFGKRFVESTDAQRRELLDLIAYPQQAPPDLSHGVAFFNSFRDLTASGFWSSRMGVDDLQYMGNVFVPEWTGCPPEALERLGVRYE